MGQLPSFDPTLRRLYLVKWVIKWKAELAKFAASINKECAVPAAGFNIDGIARHIQDFFNEQRRYKKRKPK